MKKTSFGVSLMFVAAVFVSCTTVTKLHTLNYDAIDCGEETTVWESLPASEHNPYDVTVTFYKGKCNRIVRYQDKDGTWTTTNMTKQRPITIPYTTKIMLKCESSEIFKTQCSYAVTDVRKYPTDASATVNIDSTTITTPVTCGSTVTGYSTTNRDGVDITILWTPSTTCKISMVAERAGKSSGTVTNEFIHDPDTKSRLSTIRAVKKLTVKCEGTDATTNGCSFHVVETED